jgi:hypothetical protein
MIIYAYIIPIYYSFVNPLYIYIHTYIPIQYMYVYVCFWFYLSLSTTRTASVFCLAGVAFIVVEGPRGGLNWDLAPWAPWLRPKLDHRCCFGFWFKDCQRMLHSDQCGWIV